MGTATKTGQVQERERIKTIGRKENEEQEVETTRTRTEKGWKTDDNEKRLLLEDRASRVSGVYNVA